MQLTPLQLEIQKRADKTLSFGCFVTAHPASNDKDIYTIIGKQGNFWIVSHNHHECAHIASFGENAGLQPLGHPMTRGRLFYIKYKLGNIENFDKLKTWIDVTDHCHKNIEIFQQTVLDRPEDFQLLVKVFLDTLPKELGT